MTDSKRLPQIMGVINLSPYSATSAARCVTLDGVLHQAKRSIADGASILDIGGEPTNPGVHPVAALDDELQRVVPAVEAIRANFDIPISVDTSKPEVMRAAAAVGATMINDVRAFRRPDALETAASLALPVCIMHMSHPEGTPAQVQRPHDIVPSVKDFLEERLAVAIEAGIKASSIYIDPGFGHGSFGKSTSENLRLLNQLDTFAQLAEQRNVGLLVGLSRKTFIGKILNQSPDERLYGSLAAAVIAAMKGASIIRVHDVKPTMDVIRIAMAVEASRIEETALE